MASYHVGCGAFGIYAGTLNKRKNGDVIEYYPKADKESENK